MEKSDLPPENTLPEVTTLKWLTYNDLVAHFETYDLPPQEVKNQKTALNTFLAYLNKELDSYVGPELHTNFEASADAWLAVSGNQKTTNRVNRTYLKKWQDVYKRLSCVGVDANLNFAESLLFLIAQSGLKTGDIAKRLGIRGGLVDNWLKGSRPMAKYIDQIKALEFFFGVPPSLLVNKIPNNDNRKLRRTETTNLSSYAKEISRKMSFGNYSIKQYTEELQREWEALIYFKTSMITPNGMQRNKAAKWKIDGLGDCPTSVVNKSMLDRFFGYLCLPKNAEVAEMRGLGFKPEDLSFALFTEPHLVESYLMGFKLTRTKGKLNGMFKYLASFGRDLTNPNTGFIGQTVSFGERLPKPITDPSEWREKCRIANARYCVMYGDLDGKGKTRDVEENITELLKHDHPLDILLQIGNDATTYFASKYSTANDVTWQEKIDARDLLAIKLLTSNPLRQKNYRWLTYKKDNTGHLKKHTDGSWWIKIPQEEFKNERGAAKDKDYEIMVNESIWPDIETYLKRYRPELPGASTYNYLFLSAHNSKKSKGMLGTGSYHNLIRSLVMRFCLVETTGFGPHAFRHIIATDYLKNHPEGYQMVASILHDKIETVIANYAHNTVYDGFKHWDNYLKSRQAQVRKVANA